tara:strand:+ start:37 stop:279 length:243 start_codon:yes stop_codon:yes gene_type:complete
MKLSNQAAGALMMALQKCILEEVDIMPLLREMNFQVDPADHSHSTLVVTNPPVVHFEDTDLTEDTGETDTETDTAALVTE